MTFGGQMLRQTRSPPFGKASPNVRHMAQDEDREKLAALLVRVALRVVEELREQADEKQAEALEAQAAAERVRRWALG
jgi:hypothetical protein